jgi:hypothetical protein
MARFLITLAILALGRAAASQEASRQDPVALLLGRLEEAAVMGDRAAITELGLRVGDTPSLDDFASAMTPKPTRVVIKERDRSTVENGLERVLLEVFTEHGMEGSVATWRADVRASAAEGGSKDSSVWRIARMDRLAFVSGLYRLALNPGRQFEVRNLTVSGTDLTLHLPSGRAFVAETPDGPTAVVLIGRGQMRFTPPDPAEQTQVRIFCGSDALAADFDTALIRVRPSEFDERFPREALVSRSVSQQDLRRADEYFDEYIGKTLQIDLTDLSRDRWSLAPQLGDLIAEVRTRRFGNLTYTRAGNDAEDVSVYDRKRRKNIAVYASVAKLWSRGRFYSEDDLTDYDVLAYDIDASFSPDRLWLSGTAHLTVKVRTPVLTTMTLRLAESLTVRRVSSSVHGRLLHLRIIGQNSILVNLPAPALRDTELSFDIAYSGRIEPQELDREAIAVAQDQEPVVIPLEPRYIYSNRSYWYPQSMVTDYATARLRIMVPQQFDVVASGMATGPPAPAPGPVEAGERARKMFVFESSRPLRYLACVISRFNTVTSTELKLSSRGSITLRAPGAGGAAPGGGPMDGEPSDPGAVSLSVQANPRQVGRARSMADKSAAVIQFYASLVGEAPYPSFTLAITESDLPGGHSPAYFAVLNQALPTSQLVWRNDPVSFENYPTFFLAHELAHQWWGQAIGWKNYHEQWISEGFAQYFAMLYAEKERGADVLLNLRRQMRRWAIEASSQGPIYLGYRLGHIKSDGRVFRAVIYNKAAMVLHMLRRVVGDEAFFAGVQRFYADWRFSKAGTDDFRAAMEKASGAKLDAFFEAWFYGSEIPSLKFTHELKEPGSILLKLEHRGSVMPVPVTVTLTYAGGVKEDVVINVTEKTTARSVALKGTLRDVGVNDDYGAVAEIDK